jgi:hypothetical protein
MILVRYCLFQRTHIQLNVPLDRVIETQLAMSFNVHDTLQAHSWSEAWNYSRTYGLCTDSFKEPISQLIENATRPILPMAFPVEIFNNVEEQTTTQLAEKLVMDKVSLILLERSIIPSWDSKTALTLESDISRKLEVPLLLWDHEIDAIRINNGYQLDYVKIINQSKLLLKPCDDYTCDLDIQTNDSENGNGYVQQERLVASKQCIPYLAEVIQEPNTRNLKLDMDQDLVKEVRSSYILASL